MRKLILLFLVVAAATLRTIGAVHADNIQPGTTYQIIYPSYEAKRSWIEIALKTEDINRPNGIKRNLTVGLKKRKK